MKLPGKILLICSLLMGTYGCEKTQNEPSLIGTVLGGGLCRPPYVLYHLMTVL